MLSKTARSSGLYGNPAIDGRPVPYMVPARFSLLRIQERSCEPSSEAGLRVGDILAAIILCVASSVTFMVRSSFSLN